MATVKFKYLSLFINILMKNGQREKYFCLLMEVLKYIQKLTNENAFHVFITAIDNVRPLAKLRPLEKKKKKKKKKKENNEKDPIPKGIPILFKFDQDIRWSIRCIINNSLERSENTLNEKLANEILDSYKKKSSSYNEKIDLHKAIIASKGNVYLRKKKKKKKKKKSD